MAHRSLHVQAIWRLRLSLAIAFALCAPLARANIEIEVKGVDEALRNNVLAYLSFDRYRKSEALSPDTIERLHNRVEREVAAALKPFGYYEPKTKSDLEDLGNGNWRVTVNIEPGQPVLMDRVDVRVTGPGASDTLFTRVLANPPLRPGKRLDHAAYEKIKGDLQRTAANYGYLDAKMTKNDLLVDAPNHKADALLEIETGNRYRFGTTTIEQDVIRDPLVRRYMRYEQEEPFDMTELLRTQFALDDSQYFSTVEVLPGEPDRETAWCPSAFTPTRTSARAPQLAAVMEPTPPSAARSNGKTVASTRPATASAWSSKRRRNSRASNPITSFPSATRRSRSWRSRPPTRSSSSPTSTRAIRSSSRASPR